MSIIKMYGLFLRHFYLITRSFPRILDLIYWPSIQITLWGFISNFFASHTSYYNNAVGVILTCAILYDFAKLALFFCPDESSPVIRFSI